MSNKITKNTITEPAAARFDDFMYNKNKPELMKVSPSPYIVPEGTSNIIENPVQSLDGGAVTPKRKYTPRKKKL